MLADENDAERLIEIFREDVARIDVAIAITVAQQGDAIGAFVQCAGAALDLIADPAHDAAALLRPG